MQSAVVWTPKLLDHNLKTSERCVGKACVLSFAAFECAGVVIKAIVHSRHGNYQHYTALCQWEPHYFLSSLKHQNVSHYSLKYYLLLSFIIGFVFSISSLFFKNQSCFLVKTSIKQDKKQKCDISKYLYQTTIAFLLVTYYSHNIIYNIYFFHNLLILLNSYFIFYILLSKIAYHL